MACPTSVGQAILPLMGYYDGVKKEIINSRGIIKGYYSREIMRTGSESCGKKTPIRNIAQPHCLLLRHCSAPLLVILFYAYSHFLQNESRETLGRLSMTLEAGTQSVDTSIDAAKKACITLFYDNRVKRHLKPIPLSSTEDRVAQVEIHSTINAMVAITDAVTETMLLYLDDQYVFSDGLYSFEDCFNTLYSFADYDADYWCSLLGQRIMLEMLPATQMTQKRVNTTQTVIPAVYATRVSGRPVIAVIALSVDSMVATVRNNFLSQGVQLVILDKEDRLVYGDFDTGLIHPDGAGGYERIRLADAPYHVISTSSQQSGLQYYLAVPDSVIYSMSDDYLLFIVAALVMCLVAGGCGAPRRHCGQAQAAERILSRADGHAGHRQRIQPYGQHSGLCGKALLQRPVPGTDCPGAGPVGEIYFQGVQGKDRTKPVGLY